MGDNPPPLVVHLCYTLLHSSLAPTYPRLPGSESHRRAPRGAGCGGASHTAPPPAPVGLLSHSEANVGFLITYRHFCSLLSKESDRESVTFHVVVFFCNLHIFLHASPNTKHDDTHTHARTHTHTHTHSHTGGPGAVSGATARTTGMASMDS